MCLSPQCLSDVCLFSSVALQLCFVPLSPHLKSQSFFTGAFIQPTIEVSSILLLYWSHAIASRLPVRDSCYLRNLSNCPFPFAPVALAVETEHASKCSGLRRRCLSSCQNFQLISRRSLVPVCSVIIGCRPGLWHLWLSYRRFKG